MIPFEDDLKWILEYYGSRHQLGKLAEECCELAQAIIKYLNMDENGMDNIFEEAEDVRIMLDQFELRFGRNMSRRQEKIERTKERILEEQRKWNTTTH